MIKAAIVGLGWWGRTIVESVQADSNIVRFVAGATRTVSPEVKAFVDAQKLRLVDSYETLLADRSVDAVVLATPHSMHSSQVIAAAAAGKHVFCEKPFALKKADAEAAVAATAKAGVTLGLGYNSRFHPEMTALRERIRTGALGTVLHVEATMTFPNALQLKPEAWRAQRDETPCGGLTRMGVHAIDGMIDLCGEIAQHRPGIRAEIAGMVRMDAGGREQEARMRARQLQRRNAAVFARARDDHLDDACCLRPLQHLVAVCIEAVVRQVAADIDEFHVPAVNRPAFVARIVKEMPGVASRGLHRGRQRSE